jgi:hypothetical protein
VTVFGARFRITNQQINGSPGEPKNGVVTKRDRVQAGYRMEQLKPEA